MFQLQTLAAATGGRLLIPGLDEQTSTLVIGVAILGAVYLFVLRPLTQKRKGGRRGRKKADPLATPPTQRTSLAAERAGERHMQSLVLELEKMTRELGNQIDTKTARLEALLEEADLRTQQLTKLLGQGKAAELTQDVIASTPGRSESGLAALDKHRDIYDAADSGKSASDIARDLDRPAGEIELILALRG
ncbi:MAG: hypothetical protein AAGK78_00665 [Planctomycetota bacterium]